MLNKEQIGLSKEATPSPEIAANFARYKAELADLDMSEEQQEEFLRTLWDILSTMVRLGFDVSGFDLCGQLQDGFNELAAPDSRDVDSMQAISMEHTSEQKEARDGNE